MTQEEREMMETVLRTAQRNSGKDSIDVRKLLTKANYPVGIELEKALKNPGSDDDPILREGDRIVVPRYDGTVKINGEVLYPNTVYFKDGKDADYYIDLAGGVTSTAKKSQTIIIYMNGMVARADRKHKPAPGCQIVVPTKRQRQSLGPAAVAEHRHQRRLARHHGRLDSQPDKVRREYKEYTNGHRPEGRLQEGMSHGKSSTRRCPQPSSCHAPTSYAFRVPILQSPASPQR